MGKTVQKSNNLPVDSSDPRSGWEEASKRLAALGLSDEDRDWLEAPLNAEAENELEW